MHEPNTQPKNQNITDSVSSTYLVHHYPRPHAYQVIIILNLRFWYKYKCFLKITSYSQKVSWLSKYGSNRQFPLKKIISLLFL